jgi:hypothetical protein
MTRLPANTSGISSPRAERRPSLRWEISGILAVKIAIVLLAGFTIFNAHHRLHVNAGIMAGKLFGGAVRREVPVKGVSATIKIPE